MKKLFSVILAAAITAAAAISASAAIFTYDSSDDEYWDKDVNMLDKDTYCVILSDGTVCGENGYSVDGSSVEWEQNKIENLPEGWYEAVWCDYGEDCSAAAGKIALSVRGNTNFQAKGNAAKDAGAVGLLILNNCRPEEAIDPDTGEVTGDYQGVNMSEPDNGTLPQIMLSSDASLLLAAQCTGKKVSELLPLFEALRDGTATEIGVPATSTAYIFIGTINSYKNAGEPSADNLVDTSTIEVKESEPAPVYTYPGSGLTGNLINGTIIGNEKGWGDSASCGAAAAFDGNPNTYFDPLGVGDGFCGMQVETPVTLEKVAILSRKDNAARYEGAMIQGSNDGENWTTLYTSDAAAASTDEYTVITEFENNTGYTMYRYFNETQHGDVAEVEFYSVEAATTETAAPAEETPVEEAPAAETPVEEAPAAEVETVETAEPAAEAETVETTAEEKAPETFDIAIVAGIAAVVSLAGYAVSKKR